MGLQKVGMKNLALKNREIGGSRNRGVWLYNVPNLIKLSKIIEWEIHFI